MIPDRAPVNYLWFFGRFLLFFLANPWTEKPMHDGDWGAKWTGPSHPLGKKPSMTETGEQSGLDRRTRWGKKKHTQTNLALCWDTTQSQMRVPVTTLANQMIISQKGAKIYAGKILIC